MTKKARSGSESISQRHVGHGTVPERNGNNVVLHRSGTQIQKRVSTVINFSLCISLVAHEYKVLKIGGLRR
jgi:hypothetical protein